MSEAKSSSPKSGSGPEIRSDEEASSPVQKDDRPQDPALEDIWEDWQTIDFPQAISVDALIEATQEPETIAEPPQVAELIDLIQELNQCNDMLLDRVAELEASLEQSQRTLQTEVKRSQANVEPQVLAAAQEQVTQLINQLEFSHQANQRQQILVETLTEQWESSQERVAQLERECSLMQQRWNDQVQQLMESETVCRDLRTRLQRQQRYTMQFKVALEKCLDVPHPNYEVNGESIATMPATANWNEPESNLAIQPFLPKASRIQPWSSQPQFLEAAQVAASEARTAFPQPQDADDAKLTASEWLAADSASNSASDIAIASLTTASEQSGSEQGEIDLSRDQDLPIAAAAQQWADQQLTDAQANFPADGSIDSIEPSATNPQIKAIGAIEPSAEAEDALWQDLARLIDVSTEDVVRAKSALDFAEFEQPASEIASHLSGNLSDEITSDQLTSDQLTDDAWGNFPQLPKPADLPDQPVTVSEKLHLKLPGVTPGVQSSSPSPILYPLRPTRKLKSLAAVELPTFPR